MGHFTLPLPFRWRDQHSRAALAGLLLLQVMRHNHLYNTLAFIADLLRERVRYPGEGQCGMFSICRG